MSRRRLDLTGQVFGLLTAVQDAGGPPKNQTRPWLCICRCGREKIISAASLVHGKSRSCGCRKPFTTMTGAASAAFLGDDELLQEDVRGDLEAEFGAMTWPVPTGPVWHQTLSSDAELGAFAR